MARQEVLLGPTPPDFSVVICESVVKRNVGGPEVMRAQLGALLLHGARETTILQVLPLSAEPHGLMDCPMSILTPPDGVPVIYTEGTNQGR
ncbi:Scr1 family TA system antitoxin-like transcriptional regulator [Streptomyces scopuliridis]|uniref:Scr1 family TA system antitoxin-like transcriptional regulator n=1 Tax=Streptomyces scopuliridis TaxID=452529 RepID=UPI00398D2F55